jgi:hypothetical protein
MSGIPNGYFGVVVLAQYHDSAKKNLDEFLGRIQDKPPWLEVSLRVDYSKLMPDHAQ